MWGLEGKVEVDNKLVVCLFEYVSFYDCVLQLFLENQILFLQSFECVQIVIGNQSGQKNFPKGPRAKYSDDIEC